MNEAGDLFAVGQAEQRAAAAPAAGGSDETQAAALQAQLEEQRTLATRLAEENRRLQALTAAEWSDIRQ